MTPDPAYRPWIASIVNPPTVPVWAIRDPAGDTENGADAKAVAPSQIPVPALSWIRVPAEPTYSPSVGSMVNPPIVPAVAVILPLMVADRAVNSPASETLKGASA